RAAVAEHRRVPAPETLEGGDQGAARDGARLCAGQGDQSEARGDTQRRREKDPVRTDEGRRALNRPERRHRRRAALRRAACGQGASSALQPSLRTPAITRNPRSPNGRTTAASPSARYGAPATARNG